MKKPWLSPNLAAMPRPLRRAWQRRMRKKHRSHRCVKLPRKLKKQLKKEITNYKPNDVRIESYGWVIDRDDENGWDRYKAPGFHIPKSYYIPNRHRHRKHQRWLKKNPPAPRSRFHSIAA